jgi:hypothetical protein
VGDHLLINADMGGTLDPNKIDKVDNTDSVTSVAGRTGAVVLSASDVSGLATVATSGAYSDLTGTPTLGTAAAEDVGTSAGNVVQLNGSAQLPAVDGSLLTNISASVAALNDVGDVDTTGVSTNNVLKYDGSNWVDGSVAYSEVTGTPSLATVATTGAYSDLTGAPDVPIIENNYVTSTSTATAISEDGHYAYWLGNGNTGLITLTLPTQGAGVVAYITFTNQDNSTDHTVTLSSGQFRLSGSVSATSLSIPAGCTRSFYYYSVSYWELSSNELNELGDVTITSPSNGEALIYNSTSGDWENGTVSASVAALNDVGDVAITTPANTQVIKYNSTSGDWENGAVAYADVSGTPTLATVATTGAYSDLSGLPTLGTAAALDVGTSANNVVQLNGSAQLPAVDGSQLTGISATVAALNDIGDVSAAAPNNGDVIAYNSTSGDWEATAQSGGGSAPSVTVSSPSTDQTLSAPSGIEEAYIYTPTTDINVNLVAAATCGSGFKYQIKNRSTNTITIDPNGAETVDGAATFALSIQEASVTLITDGSNWFII